MKARLLMALIVAGALLAPAAAEARFSFSTGGWVWACGRSWDQDEYDQFKQTHPNGGCEDSQQAQQPAQQQQGQPPQRPASVSAPQPYYAAPPGQAYYYAPAPPPAPVSAPVGAATTVPVAAAAAPGPAPAGNVQSASLPQGAAGGGRAASCKSVGYYVEFPPETEAFDCTAGLGRTTRAQLMQQGWKVDFVEKLPLPPGQPGGLAAYKLILSR